MTETHPVTNHSFPSSHHAFLVTTAQVHDPGRGPYVDLELASGTMIRSQATADALRLGSSLAGRWRCSLHFRTHADATLWEPVTMWRLRPDTETAIEPLWSAAGKLVQLNRAEGFVVIRVYPERAAIQPFLITATASLEQLERAPSAQFLRLRGGLRGNQLVTHQLEPLQLSIPPRWKDWKPGQLSANPESEGEEGR